MKTKRLILFIVSAAFLYNGTFAQTIKSDSVFWDNGDVSLLPEIGRVWIDLKKGGTIKEVQIREIKKEKGILVYEKEKTFHDVAIGNIKKIQPGKHSLSTMYFCADNSPYIKKEYIQMDAMRSYSDFKSLKTTFYIRERKNETPNLKESTYKSSQSFDIKTACDTLIEESGIVTLVKIIEIDPKIVTYKKLKNIDGPIYLKSFNNAKVTRYGECITVNFKK